MSSSEIEDVSSCLSLPLPIPSPSDSIQIYPSSWIYSQDFQAQLLSTVVHPALIIPATQTSEIKKQLSSLLIQRSNQRDVLPLNDDDVLPNIDRNSERKLILEQTSTDDSIYNHPSLQTILQTGSPAIRKATHRILIGYAEYSTDQLLRRILPTQIPSAFEVVGSIAHLNLRDEHIPFQYIIGQVILDKTKSIQVVVNKLGTISNEFRTFPMQVLAIRTCVTLEQTYKKRRISTTATATATAIKESTLYDYRPGDMCTSLPVELKEWGCTFTLDFCQVYWNSRLQYEHQRLVNLIAKSSETHKKTVDRNLVVADACAGVGPFAIPLASKCTGVQVYANDLNPVSYKYLLENRNKNKCTATLQAYNMDGRMFLRHLDDQGIRYDHVIMNLPAIAPEFLNVFRGWTVSDHRPLLHVYCFVSKGINYQEEALKRFGDALGCLISIEDDQVSFHIVRDVSPNKNMLCVSFRLPLHVCTLKRVESFES